MMFVEDSTFFHDDAFPTSSYTHGGDASIYASPEGDSVVVRHNEFRGFNLN